MTPDELADLIEARGSWPTGERAIIREALRLKAAHDWLFERGDGRYVENWPDGTFEAGDGGKLACPTGHGNTPLEAILALKAVVEPPVRFSMKTALAYNPPAELPRSVRTPIRFVKIDGHVYELTTLDKVPDPPPAEHEHVWDDQDWQRNYSGYIRFCRDKICAEAQYEDRLVAAP